MSISDSFYSELELQQIGFKSIGKRCFISRKASIYGAGSISIGDNVRIDDFCILSGKIILGSNIHISAYVALYGSKGIQMGDYSGISPRSTVFSAMDDFSGEYLIGPVHPEETTNISGGEVIIKRFSQIGANSVIFPDITIEEGVVVGACSMVKSNLKEWGIYAGVPAKLLKARAKGLIRFTL